MSELVRQIEQLEMQKVELQKQAELGDMAVKLNGNHEFRKLILEHFCVTKCSEFAQISADPVLDATGRADAIAMAQAAGHLKRFLSVTTRMANTADDTIRQIDAEIDELRAQGGDE